LTKTNTAYSNIDLTKKEGFKMKAIKILMVLFSLAMITNCAGSRASNSIGLIPPEMKIALAPSGGVLADAIGIELFNRGFTVIDSNQMSNMMLRFNMSELELSKPQNMEKLRAEGIDGVLVVKSVVGYDEQPQSAAVRINSTDTWQIIAGVSWQNGYGGGRGSLADRTMRADLNTAAKQIVNALTQRK
jgi:hypothetical protein